MKKIALIYDFDYTLSPKYMQEYGLYESFLSNNEDFSNNVYKFCKDNNMDLILGFLYFMIESAKQKQIKLTKEFLNNCGKNITYFEGVKNWFNNINKFGKQNNVQITHYIITCGNKELLDGMSIAKHFKKIFGSEFLFQNNVAVFPKIIINFTLKTQYLFRIKKNLLDDLSDDRIINQKERNQENQISFENMIYFGDGASDVPCMQLMKEKGGFPIAVYDEKNLDKQMQANTLLLDERVSAIAPANYSENSSLDKIVKSQILRIKERK